MRRNVSSWAIDNPTATILLFVLLTFVGLLVIPVVYSYVDDLVS